MAGAQAPSGRATYRVLRELGARTQHTYAAARDTRELVVVQRFQRVPKGKGATYEAGIAPDAMTTLIADAKALAKNFHPNVARVRHVELLGEEVLVATDLIDGATLADLTAAAAKKRETIPLPIVVRILVDVLGGLHGLHGLRDGGAPLGTFHGELCPTNVVVGKDGVARIVAAFRPRPVSVGAGSEALGYAAPEALDLGGATDARADLYAVGVMLWEALSGKRLFDEKHPGRVLQRQREEELVRPKVDESTGFAKLAEVAVRALAFDPALRFRSASELATELRRIAGTKLAPGGAVAQKVMDLAGERIRTRRAELDASPTGQQRRVSSKKLEVALPIDGDRPTALPGEAGATQPSPPPVTSPPPQVVVAPAALTPRISTPAKPPPPKKKPALVNEPPAQPISPALEAAAAATTPEPPTIVKLPERLPLHTGFGAEPPTKRDIVEKPLPIRSFAPAAPKPPPPKKDPPKIIAVSPKKPPAPDSSPKLRAPAESAPMLRDDAPGPAPESGDEIRVERESGSSLRADAITGDRPSGPIASVPITEDPPKESGPVLAPAPESAPRLAIDFASEQIPPPVEQPTPPASDPVLPIAAPESGARIAAAPIDVELPPARPRFRSSATPSGEIVPVPPTRRRLAPLVALILVVAGVLAAIGVIVSVIRGNDSHEPLVPPRVANASTSTQETPPATATVTATAEPAPPPASADPAPPTTAEEPQQQQQPTQQAPSFVPKKKRTYEPLGI